MQDAQTPQQALDMAAAATRRAHDAAALPRWQPLAAGVMGALTALMVCTLIDDGVGRPFGWAILIGGIASGWAYFSLLRLQRRSQRARGIVPRQMAELKQHIAMLVVILVVPLIGYAASASEGWIRLASSLILGGWIWFTLEQPRILAWKTRPWKS